MPTSYGSIGKNYSSVVAEIRFSRFLEHAFLKAHFAFLPIISDSFLRPCFVLDQRVFEINTEAINYGIQGVAAKFGVGMRQTVRLYDGKSGFLIKELKTNNVGEFSFQQLHPNKKYTLTTKDEDGILESVILDTISPKIY